MSVIVKGMEMPPSCYFCGLADTSFIRCEAFSPTKLLEDDCEERRPDWCPLIEIPEDARMIDANKLMKKIKDVKYKCIMTGEMYANSFFNNTGKSSVEWWCVEDLVENAPTVLEQEEE